jgi:excisionase family DNA binding protein
MSRLDDAVAELVAALREELRAGATVPGPDRLLSVAEAAEALSVGRSATYGEIAAGRLRTVKVGRRRLVPAESIAAYIKAAAGETERRRS